MLLSVESIQLAENAERAGDLDESQSFDGSSESFDASSSSLPSSAKYTDTGSSREKTRGGSTRESLLGTYRGPALTVDTRRNSQPQAFPRGARNVPSGPNYRNPPVRKLIVFLVC
jgi:hypothetical protein